MSTKFTNPKTKKVVTFWIRRHLSIELKVREMERQREIKQGEALPTRTAVSNRGGTRAYLQRCEREKNIPSEASGEGQGKKWLGERGLRHAVVRTDVTGEGIAGSPGRRRGPRLGFRRSGARGFETLGFGWSEAYMRGEFRVHGARRYPSLTR